MENFFKAHSTKKPNSKRRLKLKNKIKHMLNGYERNDRDAIRDAVEDSQEESDMNLSYDEISEIDLSTVKDEGSPRLLSSAFRSTTLEIPENSYRSMQLPRKQYSVKVNNTHKDFEMQQSSIIATYDENSSSHETDEELYHTSNHNENTAGYSENSDNMSETGSDQSSKSIQTTFSSSPLEQSINECEQSLNGEQGYSDVIINSSSFEQTLSDEDNTPNVSSSSADFDNDGHLASIILNKLNQPILQKQCEQYESFQINPSCSGYIKNKRIKRENKVLLNDITPKSVNKIFRKSEDLKEAFTIDATKKDMPKCPLSFGDSHFSTTKIITQKSVSSESKGPIFKPTKLNHVQVNHCPLSTEPSFELTVDEIDQRVVPANETSVQFNHTDVIEDSFMNCNEQEKEDNISTQFIRVNNGVIAIMSHPSTIYFHGKSNVKSLCGTVEVMGYMLDENFTEIYAPRFHFAQKLSTKANDCSHYGLFSKLTSVGLPVLKTEDIVITMKNYDAILYFEQLKDESLDFVENEFCGLEIFNMSKRTLSFEEHPDAAVKLNCSLYTSLPYKSFEEIPVWPEIIKCNKVMSSKGIVCGGKGTGKSTFLKYYINSRIEETPVVVIDLDPGQAEFTVAGNVSVTVVSKPVIGPNFTHLHEPRRMLNVGLINVLQNIERYVSAVTEILEYVKETEEYANLPWIINTMGMNNSLGLKLITYTIILLQPTFVVQMDSNMQNKCFKVMLNSQEIKTLHSEYEDDPIFDNLTVPQDLIYHHYVSSPIKQTPRENLAAKDNRYLCFLAYFGKLLRKGVDNLLSVRPYVIQLSSVKILTNCQVEENAITSVINGKIVAMCENSTTITGNTSTMEDKALLCLGFGLIRGIDLDTATVYIMCDAKSEALSRVNALLYCDCYPELMLSDARLPPGTAVPYRAPLKPHNKQFLDTPKRRFNPLQLLKIKRSQQKC